MGRLWIVAFYVLFFVHCSEANVGKITPVPESPYERATFAGGCFWCMQPPFDSLEGVIRTTVGYTKGQDKTPTYEEVCSGTTGHTEAIEVVFEPSKITYKELLDVFWRNIDPTQHNGQFADHGSQYRTGIYYHDEKQKKIALDSKKMLEDSGKFAEPIATEIEAAEAFYRAEEYHQSYYKKNSLHYQRYKIGSGRAAYIKETWGK